MDKKTLLLTDEEPMATGTAGVIEVVMAQLPDDTPTWSADTALCPLPESVHDGVAFGAASLRCSILGKDKLAERWDAEFVGFGWQSCDPGCWVDVYGGAKAPVTHWQPLPAPP